MATILSNNFCYRLLKAEIDFDTDVFKIILMASGFGYNRVTHDGYADVSASELATAYGYTAGGATLGSVAVAQDDTGNKGKVTWANPSWTATGGNLVASGAIIYDDTVAGDPIVGYIDFAGDQTTYDGGVFTVAAVEVDIAG